MKFSFQDSTLTRGAIIVLTGSVALFVILASLLLFLQSRSLQSELQHSVIEWKGHQIMQQMNTALAMAGDEKDQFLQNLKGWCTPERGFLYLVVYQRTSDDNYFRVAALLPLSDIPVSIKTGDVVKEKGMANYIRRGLFEPVVQEKIFSHHSSSWVKGYAPVTIENTTFVVQFFMDATDPRQTMDRFYSILRRYRPLILILLLSTLAVTGVATLVLNHKVTLLLRRLSDHLKRAAEGDFEVALGKTGDRELEELAHSFNSLVEGLKLTRDRPSEQPLPLEDDTESRLFSKGVELLKDSANPDALGQATSIFHSLVMLHTDVFKYVFNLGVCYARSRRYTDALSCFIESDKLNPGHELSQRYIEKIHRLQERASNG